MKRFLLYYIIISFSIIIIPFTSGTAYYPQYIILFLSLVLVFTKKFTKNDIPLFLLGLVVLSTKLTNPESFRLSTVGYTVLNVCLFSYYTKLLPQSGVSEKSFQNLAKYIIYAFAIVLLIQDVSQLAGIPQINKSYNIGDGFKFNSLAFEASQIGAVITILMYGFIKMEELFVGHRMSISEFYGREKWLVIAYLFVSIFSLSVACMFSSVVLFAYFVDKRKLIRMLAYGGVVVLVVYAIGTQATDRAFTMISPILSGDTEGLYAIDASASARINPLFYYFHEFDLESINTWLGYGCDYGRFHTWALLTGDKGGDTPLVYSGIAFFLYDYGIVAFVLYLNFIFSICNFRSYAFFIFITLFAFHGVNFYCVWLFFMIIYSITYYQKCQNKYQ